MDLLKTPSTQSLVDSDIGSMESLQSLDIEELDEAEYGLPLVEQPPSLEELLSEERSAREPPECSSLQAELLQAVSQQLLSAQNRSSAGAATTLTVGDGGQLAVGTAHGHLLAFQGQTLRWACVTNSDRGAVTCLAYNRDGSRLLAGYARGLICQVESTRGIMLRKVVPGGGVWGALRVAWADASGLSLDTGGSVWLLKFSRPLGVRSARVSCLFSGARGEVVAMAAKDARILALATLSRVIIVAGGRAAAVRLTGPPHTLPVLAWCECEERILVCARGDSMQWHAVNVEGTSLSLTPLRCVQLKMAPLWMGFLSGKLAILDVNEQLRLWEDDDEHILDLTPFQLVYASAFFKGVFTDGRVSAALSQAGAGALGGAGTAQGGLTLLGAAGIVRVHTRAVLERARALAGAGRAARALRLLAGAGAAGEAAALLRDLAREPGALAERGVAAAAVTLCLRNGLTELLWGELWEQCCHSDTFTEAVGAAVAEMAVVADCAPAPDVTQALLERLAVVSPDLVERVIVALPLTSIDPHQAMILVRARGLWRAAASLLGLLSGPGAALAELGPLVGRCRGAGRAGHCACAGDALLVCAADGLAGRGAGGARLPDHAQPAARHHTLTVLLEEPSPPLKTLLLHDTSSVVRLLRMCSRDPPFVGPLGKQNRLRVARCLLAWTADLEDEDKLEVVKFITSQLNQSALPADPELTSGARDLATALGGARADRAWLALLERPHTRGDLARQLERAAARPRVRWHVLAMLGRHAEVLPAFFGIDDITKADIDDLFEYLGRRSVENSEETKQILLAHAGEVVAARPRAAAALVWQAWPAEAGGVAARLARADRALGLQFCEALLEIGALSGEAATEYLQAMCVVKPYQVVPFLTANPDLIKPEKALEIIKKAGPKSAEPVCLEAMGEYESALMVSLELVAQSEDGADVRAAMSAACELCARAASRAAPEATRRMWSAVLACRAAELPAAAVLEAFSHAPLDALASRLCALSPDIAIALCRSAAVKESSYACAARILKAECHDRVARELRAAGRGLAVRGARCVACAAPLGEGGEEGEARAAVRVWGCGHAAHAECAGPERCAACGARAAREVRSPAARVPPAAPTARAFELQLAGPPLPDLDETT